MCLLYHHSVHTTRAYLPNHVASPTTVILVRSLTQDYQASKSLATTTHVQHVDINYYSGPRTLSGQNKRDLLCKFYAITKVQMPVPVAARSKA